MKEKNRRTEISTLRTMLRSIIEGNGYQFGEPWQLASECLSAVVPILKMFVRDRQYVVIQEISQDKITVVDSGRINRVSVKIEDVKKPIFVRAGTIFKGQGTQSRTSSMGVILESGKENLVDVFCVHATHGISPHSAFSVSSVVPRKVEDILVSPSKSQATVWNAASVRCLRSSATQCPSCGSSNLLQSYEAELVCMQCGFVISPTLGRDSAERTRIDAHSTMPIARDNLVANLDEMAKFNEKVEEMLSKVPADIHNQVGIAIIDSHGVLGLEMFDHPDSWRAFSKSIVRNYADVLAKERVAEGLFALKTERIPEAVKKFLEKAEGLPETSIFKNRIGETRVLSGEVTGEYSTIGPDVIHLILKRKTCA